MSGTDLLKNVPRKTKEHGLPHQSIKRINSVDPGSEHIKECLQDAAGVLIIQDREGDMFEQFEQIPDQKTHLLVRSRFNRSLRDGRKLWHALSLAPLAGSYQMAIDADKKLQEPARTATIDVRYARLTWPLPHIIKNIKPFPYMP